MVMVNINAKTALASLTKLSSGDLIEWVYIGVYLESSQLVRHKERLYSSIDHNWYFVGSEMIHAYISYDNDTIVWLNKTGLCRARTTDMLGSNFDKITYGVVPRRFTYRIDRDKT